MRTPHWGGQAGYVWICSLCGCYLSTRCPYLGLCSTSPPPCSSSPSLCLGRGWGVHHHSTHWQPGSWRKVFVVRETSNLTLVVCSERVNYSKANICTPTVMSNSKGELFWVTWKLKQWAVQLMCNDAGLAIKKINANEPTSSKSSNAMQSNLLCVQSS